MSRKQSKTSRSFMSGGLLQQISRSLSLFQKVCICILGVLIVLAASLNIAIYRAFNVNPDSLHMKTMTIRSPKIPPEMDQVSAVYITDLEYGQYSSTAQTEALFHKIQALNPDFFFFGGDLFDWNYDPTQNDLDLMTAWLSGIQAPLGKFAVHGEQDVFSEQRTRLTDDVLSDAQIEVLKNASIPLGNQSSAGIRLCTLSIQPDPKAAFDGLSAEQFNLLLTHYPDHLLREDTRLQPLGLALAGNAHGTQITWPLIGGYKDWPGSQQLNRADLKRLNFEYYLSSGLGCIDVDARLNAPVELVYILFESA